MTELSSRILMGFTNLIPNMALVIIDGVPLQKRSVFVLKRHQLVMLLLTFNVPNDLIQMRLTDRKRAIAALPVKFRKARRRLLDPRGRGSFDLFNYMGD